MTRQIALCVYSLVILGLFYLDRDRKSRVSFVLWLPALWMLLGASRAVSSWLETPATESPDQYLEGSPLDRAIYLSILASAALVLLRRGPRVLACLRANPLIVAFLLYCAVSALWSDFPLVAFKRWVKTLGNVAMVLIVLTEPDQLAAFKRVFARAGFVLIPVSVLFIKYYPELGRGYTATWQTFYSGVAGDKNGLGAICMIWGLFSVWRLTEAYRERDTPGRAAILAAHGITLCMAMWLLHMADSSTSLVCLILGSGLLLLSRQIAKQRPAAIHALVGTLAGLSAVAYLLEDVWSSFIHSLGRQTDLTGRTELWKELLQFDVNRLVGTGFESFWLGPRASYFWEKYYWHPNQAHNGYLEVYLNLGWIGVAFLVLLMAIAYRNAVRAFRQNLPWAPLLLSFVVIVVIYNMTEAAFKVVHPVYIAFLFAAIAPPVLAFQSEQGTVDEAGWLAPNQVTDVEEFALETDHEFQLSEAGSLTLGR